MEIRMNEQINREMINIEKRKVGCSNKQYTEYISYLNNSNNNDSNNNESTNIESTNKLLCNDMTVTIKYNKRYKIPAIETNCITDKGNVMMYGDIKYKEIDSNYQCIKRVGDKRMCDKNVDKVLDTMKSKMYMNECGRQLEDKKVDKVLDTMKSKMYMNECSKSKYYNTGYSSFSGCSSCNVYKDESSTLCSEQDYNFFMHKNNFNLNRFNFYANKNENRDISMLKKSIKMDKYEEGFDTIKGGAINKSSFNTNNLFKESIYNKFKEGINLCDNTCFRNFMYRNGSNDRKMNMKTNYKHFNLEKNILHTKNLISRFFSKNDFLKFKLIDCAISLYIFNIRNYLNRGALSLMNHFRCYLPFTLLIGFIYLKRYLLRVKGKNDCYFFVKLYLVCCLIGNKYWEDSGVSNFNESSAWGFELEEINMLEKHILNALNYDLEISVDEIESIIYYERMCP